MESKEPVALMILNQNGKPWLPPLFQSIQRNGYPDVRIYLVDNNSEDGSVEATLRDYPDITVIRIPRNLGYSMAYNIAMPRAFADGCEWVIWSNSDILLESGCLSELMSAVQSDPAIAVAGPAFLSWDSDQPNYYMKGKCPALIPFMQAKSRTPVDVDWVEGSFLMVSRRAIRSIGSLDPCFFMCWEEAEFCRRVRFSGRRVVLVPSAWVRHHGGAFSEGRRNLKMDWLHSKNYYVYTLTDPGRSFARNLLQSIHLFAVNMKVRTGKSPGLMPLEVLAFTAVMARIETWYQKWNNDRRHIQPALLKKKFQGIRPQIRIPLGDPPAVSVRQ